jgi:hypothetical protein
VLAILWRFSKLHAYKVAPTFSVHGKPGTVSSARRDANLKGTHMAIERSTQGLIKANFDLLDAVIAAPKVTPEQAAKVKAVSTIVGNITKVAGLDLAHKKFAAKAPEFALANSAPLVLVNEQKAAA